MMRFAKPFLAGAAALAAALPASAHVGFVLPDSFAYKSCSGFGAIATFSDYFPSPEIVLSAEFRLVGPQGQAIPLDEVTADHAMTRLEASLDMPGTYRITSDERLGRKGKVALVEGRYERLGGEDMGLARLPAGAQILTSQTATVSEAYLNCGGANTAADTSPAGQLAVTPGQDADSIGQSRTFRVTFGGAPLAAREAFLIPAYAFLAGAHDGAPLIVSPGGEIRLEDLAPGVYALLVRHIAPAPEGAETDVRSYSTAVTFAVGELHP
ncbi:DUF4198 domain-containing protein [Hyphomonas polymorpha]|nr:DUF4198 domain-containing protein [Hyphomonas polymorpha]